MDNSTNLSAFQKWVLAIRPKTLPAAAAPVVVGTAVAIHDGVFSLLPAAAALCVALLLQIAANLSNDLFDFQKGVDNTTRLGPTRVVQAGILSQREVMIGTIFTVILAALLGLYLATTTSWVLLLVGLLAIISTLAYTGGPFPLGYNGLGDLFVFIFFGLVAVNGTYFVQAKTLTPLIILLSLPIGLLVTNILVVNNLRDINTDRVGGKRTLAVRLGEINTQRQYDLLLITAYIFPLISWISGLSSPWVMLSWASIPMALGLSKSMHSLSGRALNKVLAGTGQLELLFSLLLGLGLIVG